MLHWLRFWQRRRNHCEAADRPSPVQAVVSPSISDIAVDDPPEYADLLQALEDPAPELRGRAIEALIGVGGPVVPALAARLGHAEAHVRQAAVLALADIGPEAAPALAALVRAAVDRDDGVRRTASAALARVDPAWAIAPEIQPALPAVVEALKSNIPRVNQAAHTLLVRIGRPAVPALIELLAEWEELGHRLAALGLLAQLGPSAGEAAPALAEVLGSGEPELRQAAAGARATWAPPPRRLSRP